MITLFSTAKAFVGHLAIIQRNALESWRRLDPDIEIILFGDDQGVAQVREELCLRYERRADRRLNGTKSVRSVFAQAQQLARHEYLCYCNCDIVLTSDFARAFREVSAKFDEFLMVGRRWDLDVDHSIDFSRPDWGDALVQRAHREGFQRLYYNIDYFAFHRGLYRNVPELVIGRNWWDQWLVWQAAAAGVPVVDVSDAVCAVHQNHDYSYHPRGMSGVWLDQVTRRNFREAGGWSHLHTIEDANWRLTADGELVTNRLWRVAPARRAVRRVAKTVRTFARTRLWHPLLEQTRPLRAALGLRANALGLLRRHSQVRRHWLDQ